MIEDYLAELFNKLFINCKKRIPNNIAIVNDNKKITYSELEDLLNHTIANLNNLKLDSNDTIALRINNPLILFIFYLSLLRMRISHIIVNPNDTYALQEKELNITNVSIIIQDFIDDKDLTKTVFINEHLVFSISEDHFEIKKTSKSKNVKNIAFIFHGSGTTNNPKKIAITWDSFADQVQRDSSFIDFKEGENYYTWTELYYNTPKRRLFSMILQGLTVYIPSKKPNDIVVFCLENNINHLALTTSQSKIMLSIIMSSKKQNYQNKFPALKSLVVSSSIINENLRNNILKYITKNLYIGYGCNEMGEVTILKPNEINKYKDSVGKPLKGIKLKVFDDNYNILENECIGNIGIKSNYMINSYYQNEYATNISFKIGFYFRFELGLKKDDTTLIFHSRKDDLIIFSGVNIYPKEIEEVLEKHPSILEVAVFSLKSEDEEEYPFAAVVLRTQFTEEDLITWAKKYLGWKVQMKVFFFNKLPKNKSGKI
ncbi:class I adenylate-forming enzyme family protein, partial [Poseidonibacter sp.]|uniref:class I adenylate-forming enzyme family protein n=1 Tax=Poseidonibacter sp. TaxID=2321188 RepID=UPI003C7216AB